MTPFKPALIAGLTTFLAVGLTANTSHAQADHALKRCRSTAKTLLNKLESEGGTYVTTFERWEKTCVKDAAPLEALPGYEDIRSAYKKLKPVATKLQAEYDYDVAVQDTWHWVKTRLGEVKFHSLRDKKSRRGRHFEGRRKRMLAELAECKDKLDTLFAKYPKARKAKTKHDERTLQEVYNHCAGGAEAKANKDLDRRLKARVATEKGYIMDTERTYKQEMELFARSRKISKRNKKYGALQAIRNYDYVMRDLSKIARTVNDAMRDEPSLKTASFTYAGKTMTGLQLQKRVIKDLEAAKAEARKITPKVKRQYKKWQAEFKRRAKGDRKKIFRKYGQPDLYDGRNLDDPSEQLKMATSKGSWWIYNTGDCEVTYSFRNNRKISKKVTPITCRVH